MGEYEDVGVVVSSTPFGVRLALVGVTSGLESNVTLDEAGTMRVVRTLLEHVAILRAEAA